MMIPIIIYRSIYFDDYDGNDLTMMMMKMMLMGMMVLMMLAKMVMMMMMLMEMMMMMMMMSGGRGTLVAECRRPADCAVRLIGGARASSSSSSRPFSARSLTFMTS